VRLTAVSELNIYFYSSGQILRTSNVNKLTALNSENIVIDYISAAYYNDWEGTLSIEFIDLSGTQGSECLEDQMTYDQCIISQFLQLGNNSRLSHLFLPNVHCCDMLSEGVDISAVQEFYAIILSQDAVSKCSRSCSYLKTRFEQKATRKFVTDTYHK